MPDQKTKKANVEREIQWTLLNSKPTQEPTERTPSKPGAPFPNPRLALDERGPSIYSENISLDRDKLAMTANGYCVPQSDWTGNKNENEPINPKRSEGFIGAESQVEWRAA